MYIHFRCFFILYPMITYLCHNTYAGTKKFRRMAREPCIYGIRPF